MINELYNRRILYFAGNIPRSERLSSPDATVTEVSRLCGSRVTVDLCLDGDTVTDFAHEVKACALGQAASSIMARHVIGSTKDELIALAETMRAMLKEKGPAPTVKWSDLEILEPVSEVPSRHTSVMLTFEAVNKAIAQIQTERSVPASTGDTAGCSNESASS